MKKTIAEEMIAAKQGWALKCSQAPAPSSTGGDVGVVREALDWIQEWVLAKRFRDAGQRAKSITDALAALSRLEAELEEAAKFRKAVVGFHKVWERGTDERIEALKDRNRRIERLTRSRTAIREERDQARAELAALKGRTIPGRITHLGEGQVNLHMDPEATARVASMGGEFRVDAAPPPGGDLEELAEKLQLGHHYGLCKFFDNDDPRDCNCDTRDIAEALRSHRCHPTPQAVDLEGAWLIEYTNHDWSRLWWNPNRNGYTAVVLGAGIYTEEEAKEQAARRDRDKAVKLSDLLGYCTDPGMVFELLSRCQPTPRVEGEKPWPCVKRGKEVMVPASFEPKMCCNGDQCGCMGLPIEPVLCDPCGAEVYGEDVPEWIFNAYPSPSTTEEPPKCVEQDEHRHYKVYPFRQDPLGGPPGAIEEVPCPNATEEPPCETCGGSGEVPAPGVEVMDNTKEPPRRTMVFPDPDEPCPACTGGAEEPDGTKRFREHLAGASDTIKDWPDWKKSGLVRPETGASLPEEPPCETCGAKPGEYDCAKDPEFRITPRGFNHEAPTACTDPPRPGLSEEEVDALSFARQVLHQIRFLCGTEPEKPLENLRHPSLLWTERGPDWKRQLSGARSALTDLLNRHRPTAGQGEGK